MHASLAFSSEQQQRDFEDAFLAELGRKDKKRKRQQQEQDERQEQVEQEAAEEAQLQDEQKDAELQQEEQQQKAAEVWEQETQLQAEEKAEEKAVEDEQQEQGEQKAAQVWEQETQLQAEEKAVEQLPECLFCRDYMHHETQALESLACSHTFHEKCLRDYCAATKRVKADARPYKCKFQGNGDDQLMARLLASGDADAAGPSGISTTQVGVAGNLMPRSSSSSSVVEESQEIGDRVLE